MAGTKKSYASNGPLEFVSEDKKIFRWLIPGLVLTLIVVVILWLIYPSLTSKNEPGKKAELKDTEPVAEEKAKPKKVAAKPAYKAKADVKVEPKEVIVVKDEAEVKAKVEAKAKKRGKTPGQGASGCQSPECCQIK